MRFSDSKVRRGRAGPRFGEDSGAVLAELGYTVNEIGRLMEEGIVKGPSAKVVRS
jgi:crotonobetainyl-CoA:carnitine CoA-transferase CaiB-like acyl-CoA transferase